MEKIPMVIPKRVRIGGFWYKVVLETPKETDLVEIKYQGRIDYNKMTITLRADLCLTKQWEILLHEVLHAIDLNIKSGLEEDDIVRMGLNLHQFMVDNGFLGEGKLAILEKDGEKDPGVILEAIGRWGVTHINFVPSMFNVFV